MPNWRKKGGGGERRRRDPGRMVGHERLGGLSKHTGEVNKYPKGGAKKHSGGQPKGGKKRDPGEGGRLNKKEYRKGGCH